MTKQTINLGTPNGKDGDLIRDAFDKVNDNFDEVYQVLGVSSLTELAQDYASQMFVNGTHTGVTATYDDLTNKLNLTVIVDGGNASTTF